MRSRTSRFTSRGREIRKQILFVCSYRSIHFAVFCLCINANNTLGVGQEQESITLIDPITIFSLAVTTLVANIGSFHRIVDGCDYCRWRNNKRVLSAKQSFAGGVLAVFSSTMQNLTMGRTQGLVNHNSCLVVYAPVPNPANGAWLPAQEQLQVGWKSRIGTALTRVIQ